MAQLSPACGLRLFPLAAIVAALFVGSCPFASVAAEPLNPPPGATHSPAGPNETVDAISNIRAIIDAGVPVRILLLGDSITQAQGQHYGYRYYLWIMLTGTGIDFDFIGSMSSNYPADPSRPKYRGKTFDPDHEGHSGWRADHILNGPPQREDYRLDEWLKTYTPNVVLIHLGTNDTLISQSATGTQGELMRIINALRGDNSNVIILLAKLIPVSDADANARINNLNKRMDDIVWAMSNDASPVIVVDLNNGFDAETDMYDGLHPNESGERKMARKWFQALKGILGI